MITNYDKAYTEVLEIIKYFPQEEYQKIPKNIILFYKENMDKNYIFKINPKMELSKQNISAKANAIIINLFKEYFATENQKVKIDQILLSKQEKEEETKRKKYNPDNLFENNYKEPTNTDKENKNVNLITYKKQNVFQKMFTKILNIFKIN